MISIHALLAESDGDSHPTPACRRYFYPRSPCGERLVWMLRSSAGRGFLSTLSLRRATDGDDLYTLPLTNFYPRSPCGERPSICQAPILPRNAFLSTLSLRRATWYPQPGRHLGSDFYPRSPCGERLLVFAARQPAIRVFLSTLSLRRATRRVLKCDNRAIISIHALLAESDRRTGHSSMCTRRFLSTLSLRRATLLYAMGYYRHSDFYPRSPCGERQSIPVVFLGNNPFLSTLSLRRATQQPAGEKQRT